jgi:hypothetical protein
MSTVRRNEGAGRYEILVDDEVAGKVTYIVHEGRIVLNHTKVRDEYAGQGLAGTLVRSALDDIRARGEKAVALCPYVASWVDRHPDYADVLDREALEKILAGG